MKKLLIIGLIVLGACAKKQVIKPVEVPKVEVQRGEGRVQVDYWAVYFEFDKADLDLPAMQALLWNVAYLQGSASILVEGHCDERGSVEYNQELGERRAQAVKDFYINNGIEAGRITAVSYGKARPIAGGSNERDWALNRRVETR